jgi:hypothetical protein
MIISGFKRQTIIFQIQKKKMDFWTVDDPARIPVPNIHFETSGTLLVYLHRLE